MKFKVAPENNKYKERRHSLLQQNTNFWCAYALYLIVTASYNASVTKSLHLLDNTSGMRYLKVLVSLCANKNGLLAIQNTK